MNNNKDIRESFNIFCEQHPELRFWQALLGFVQFYDSEVQGIFLDKLQHVASENGDTFYYEKLTE